jgi:hypothetical protein
MAKCCFALLILSIIAYVSTRENIEPQKPSKLIVFICALSKNLVEVENDAKTIAILKFGTKLPEEFIDEVGLCISKDVSVVVADYKKEEVPMIPFKPSLVVLMTGKVSAVKKIFPPFIKSY